MEMFNVHRRDIMDFDNYMDLKKPGFGGPSSAKAFRDNSGKKINKDPRLAEYQRTVERDPLFSHPVYNPTYKAMSNDLVYKQEKKKAYNYKDPYLTAVPVTNVPLGESVICPSFNEFINEEYGMNPMGEYGDDYYEDEYYGDDEYNDYEDEEYGMNPMGEETRIACRNEDKAEDILLDMRIDWDGWDEAPVGTGKSFTKDGDIVAYFDNSVRPHQLVILPEAEKMPEEEYARIMQSDDDYETEEEYDDEYETEEEYDEEPSNLEKRLKSYED
jgi:hypothetical protein